ncbi:MAG: hypothetical protein Q9226_006180 [Calogaya cf. arnoldii]
MEDRVPPLASQDRIRKGMVLMSHPDPSAISSLRAYNGFVALLEPTVSLALHPGESMIAYIASIRAPARVTTAEGGNDNEGASSAIPATEEYYKITCEFFTTQEWFEIGSRVLVMPASGFDLSNAGNDKGEKLSVGLEGFVGRIIQGLG